ncbi:hypothetical protein JCM16303_004891 [Sporobolomyces ruberrimus]
MSHWYHRIRDYFPISPVHDPAQMTDQELAFYVSTFTFDGDSLRVLNRKIHALITECSASAQPRFSQTDPRSLVNSTLDSQRFRPWRKAIIKVGETHGTWLGFERDSNEIDGNRSSHATQHSLARHLSPR